MNGHRSAHGLEAAWVVIALVAIALAAVLVIVVPRGGPRTGLIDGFSVGVAIDCASSRVDCADAIRAGREALAARDNIADRIRAASVHAEGEQLVNGTRSQPLYVFVFTLDDGTARAVGASCGIGPCQTVESYSGG